MKRSIQIISIMCFLVLGSSVAHAEQVSLETSRAIGIMDFILRHTELSRVKCGEHVCDLAAKDSGVALVLSHSTMAQDKQEDLHYTLRINVSGALFKAGMVVRYMNDQNKEVVVMGKKTETIDHTYKTEHKILRGWISLIKEKM